MMHEIYVVDKHADWTLRHVPADQIRSVWDEVRWFLEKVLIECKNCDTWVPEDVYHEIKSGRAHLHVVGQPLFGCLVLQVLKDPYIGDTYLHVWIAYSKTLGAIQRLMPDLEYIARTVGAKRITCHSPFDAFADAGFKKKLMIFERKV
jgi:hypothetical protein